MLEPGKKVEISKSEKIPSSAVVSNQSVQNRKASGEAVVLYRVNDKSQEIWIVRHTDGPDTAVYFSEELNPKD